MFHLFLLILQSKTFLNMKAIFKPLIFAAAFCTFWGASALDLPVKRIQGRDYYIYNVKRNENIFDIADQLGVSRADIIKFNPAAAEGVRMGNVLYLPVEEFAENNTALSGMSSGEDGSTIRYKVEKGETLFGIAYKFGVTPDEISELNPQANSGVRAGMVLKIPAADAPALANALSNTDNKTTENTTEFIPEPEPREARLRPVDRQIQPPMPAPEAVTDTFTTIPELPEQEARLRPVNPPLVFVDSAAETNHAGIALMLPLMLDNPDAGNGRTERSASDFARGFMLGLRAERDAAADVLVKVMDTENGNGGLKAMINPDSLDFADVIISPDNINSLSELLPVADETNSYVLNLFEVSDTSYITNPLVLQANIPAQLMYEKAAETLLASFSEHIPVFLISKGGKGEKLPFTNYLREVYANMGIEPMELTYEGMLTSADIEDLDPESQYVFIPASGSSTEFNKFARTLATRRQQSADPTSTIVWGYPDWTTFRGDNLELLHRLGAVIYSRFYCDENSPEVREFIKTFTDTFGCEPLEQVPSQAIMGYDTARYLIQNIAANDGSFTPCGQEIFRGLQNSYFFFGNEDDPENHQGPVNNVLYIVTFLPGDGVSISVI